MIQTLLLAGIATIPITRNLAGVKLSDLLFGIAVLLAFPWLMQALRKMPLGRSALQILAVIAALFVCILVATLNGYEKYGIVLDNDGEILLARYVLDTALFVATYCLARRYPHFLRLACTLLVVSASLLVVLTLPGISPSFYFSERFVGFDVESQPNVVALIVSVAAVIAWVLALNAHFEKRRSDLLGAGIALAILLFLLWQTQSRSVMIGALLIFPVCAGVVMNRYVSRKFFFRMIAAAVAAISGLAFLLIYSFDTLVRIVGVVMPRALPNDADTIIEVAQRFSLPELLSLYASTDSSARGLDIQYYWPLIVENPLGIGVSFQQDFRSYLPIFDLEEGPNTLLDLPIYAGYAGVACILVLLFIVGFRVAEQVRLQGPYARYRVAAAMALFFLWMTATMLGSPIFNHEFWILLALSIA